MAATAFADPVGLPCASRAAAAVRGPEREGIPLATLDAKLGAAAQVAGVPVLGC